MDALTLLCRGLWSNRDRWGELSALAKHSLPWEAVERLGSMHGVIPQLLFALQHVGLKGDLQQKWREEAARAGAENLSRRIVLGELSRLLAHRGIPILLLKGASAAWSRYPTPDLRPMADLDLLVPPSRFNEALAVMVEAGYRTLQSGEWNLLHPRLPSVSIDLHEEVFPWLAAEGERLWDRARPAFLPGVFTLPPEEALVVEACHAILAHGFPRLLWLGDLALLTHEEIDWDRVERIARVFRVTVPFRVALGLASRWAGASTPPLSPPTRWERVQARALLRMAGSLTSPPVPKIGHLLLFLWDRDTAARGRRLKNWFFPSARFLARRYGEPIPSGLRPLLILGEAARLVGALVGRLSTRPGEPPTGEARDPASNPLRPPAPPG